MQKSIENEANCQAETLRFQKKMDAEVDRKHFVNLWEILACHSYSQASPTKESQVLRAVEEYVAL